MTDLSRLIVKCSRWEDMVAAKNSAVQKIPPDVRRQFNDVFSVYTRLYGLEGAFVRMNNRSVATILDEFDPSIAPKPIESGMVDGMRYTLYAPCESQESKEAPKE